MRIRDEVLVRVTKIVEEQLGVPVKTSALLREDVGASSLDMASVQIGLEDDFGLEFGTANRSGPIDAAWDEAKTIEDLTDLVLRFAP